MRRSDRRRGREGYSSYRSPTIPKRVKTIAKSEDHNIDARSTISKTKPRNRDGASANSENTTYDVCWIFTKAEQAWRDATDFEVTRRLSYSGEEDQRKGDVVIC